ncbi:MAG: SNF2-related protein, partial [Planctomycetia bacterium]
MRSWMWPGATNSKIPTRSSALFSTGVPVKLAHYEVLGRDRDLVAELGLSFDLVVLDEAQRIKNRASQTSEAVRSVSRRRSWA